MKRLLSQAGLSLVEVLIGFAIASAIMLSSVGTVGNFLQTMSAQNARTSLNRFVQITRERLRHEQVCRVIMGTTNMVYDPALARSQDHMTGMPLTLNFSSMGWGNLSAGSSIPTFDLTVENLNLYAASTNRLGTARIASGSAFITVDLYRATVAVTAKGKNTAGDVSIASRDIASVLVGVNSGGLIVGCLNSLYQNVLTCSLRGTGMIYAPLGFRGASADSADGCVDANAFRGQEGPRGDPGTRGPRGDRGATGPRGQSGRRLL